MDIYNITNIAHLFNYTNNSIKNKLLEPLNCLIRICLLKYKPSGTKLSISDNSIVYNETSLIQGVLRTFNDDKRDDLHNLFNPIYYSTEWYPVHNDKYKFIFEQTLLGLDKLINTYNKDSIIHHTLKHYKLIIHNHINEITNDIQNNLKSNCKETQNNIINYMMNIWNPDEINILYNLLYYLSKLEDNKLIELYCTIIESILENKEEELYNYIQNITTKYE